MTGATGAQGSALWAGIAIPVRQGMPPSRNGRLQARTPYGERGVPDHRHRLATCGSAGRKAVAGDVPPGAGTGRHRQAHGIPGR